MNDPSGDAFGVLGTTSSPDGGGVGAGNLAGGPDLIVDGTADGATDLDLYQWGIDRASAGVENLTFTNSISGSLDLWVDGSLNAVALFADGAGVTNVDAEFEEV